MIEILAWVAGGIVVLGLLFAWFIVWTSREIAASIDEPLGWWDEDDPDASRSITLTILGEHRGY